MDIALVFWDQYSRYPVIKFVTSSSAEATIPQFVRVFNTYGIPEEVKTDNGPPFNGSKFVKFAKELGFKQRTVTPGWAEANGDVERFMQILKKTERDNCKLEDRGITQEV